MHNVISETKQADIYEKHLRETVDVSWIKPGITYKKFYEKDNPHNCLEHIRAIVDNDYVVIRRWNKERFQWTYFIEHLDIMRYNHSLGRYVNIRETKDD